MIGAFTVMAAGAGGGPSDPHFDNVVLLLDFDDANGAVSTTDKSNSAHGVAFHGNAGISDGQTVHNNSLHLDGNGDYLSLADSPDWALGSTYTIEMYVFLTGYGNSPNAYNSLIGQRSTTNFNAWYMHTMTGNLGGYGPAFQIRNSSQAVVLDLISPNSGDAQPINQWAHVAIASDGSTVRAFLNGNLTDSDSAPVIGDCPDALTIGRFPQSGEEAQGYIGWVRITKGVCRYTSSFTPNTNPYIG